MLTEEVEEAQNGDSQKVFGIIEMSVCSWVLASIGIINRRLSNLNAGVILFWHPLIGFLASLLVVSVYSAIMN